MLAIAMFEKVVIIELIAAETFNECEHQQLLVLDFCLEVFFPLFEISSAASLQGDSEDSGVDVIGTGGEDL